MKIISLQYIQLTCEANPSQHGFCARQHICYSAHMLSPVRLSVRPSVRHTGGSVKNA